MKRNIIAVLGTCLIALTTIVSCQKADDPKSLSEIGNKETIKKAPQTVFDHWLKRNYVDAYNVDVQYKFVDRENDQNANLTPASLEKSMQLAGVIQHAWFDVYGELLGTWLLKGYSPRQIAFVGSKKYNNNGTVTLGVAENGIKITLYNVNELDVTNLEHLNFWFLGTLHHEFGHILHQNKVWDPKFKEISKGDYITSWHQETKISQYAPLGFVTAYARSSEEEDFTEVAAKYITWEPSEWDKLFAAAGEEGTKKLKLKIKYVKEYMQNTWQCDMDKLRDIALRRSKELGKIDFIKHEWRELLEVEAPTER